MYNITKSEVVNFFSKLVEFKSISTSQRYDKDVIDCVSFLKSFFEKEFKSNLEFCKVVRHKNSKPLLLVKVKSKLRNSKTVGVYGHYDVQPEDPIDEWRTNPFKLVNKNGKFYGRGTADNKGHIVLNIFAVLDLLRSGRNKNNFVFVLEGEEESGNEEGLEKMLRSQKQLLSDIDVFFITDVGMFARNRPQIYYALRGIVCFELEIEVGKRDLHSGVYGNLVLNPAHIISDYIARLKDPFTNKIKIKGFYDDVKRFSDDELQILKKNIKSKRDLINESGLFDLVKINNIDFSLGSKIYPSLDVNGVWSGFVDQGFKTVIPVKAGVKFSCRLVEYQKPKVIEDLVLDFTERYFNKHKGVQYKIRKLASAEPFYTDYKNEFIQHTANLLEKSFKNSVVYNRSGGSIPAAEIFQRIFSKPIVLTGFTLPDDNIHSPNENFDEEMFWKGLDSLIQIYEKI
ncbi:MAG: hypothetical protein KatS3mg090_0685 [Patescibacteria group bacterium]|nr:MAG: hypothetical protein KatS3mg090_0685 [Patescibacteria group bacterium]